MTPPYHMTPDEFRRHGVDVIEWVARYMEEVESYPVASRVDPGDVRSRLPERAPEAPEDFVSILDDLTTVIMPGITHWQSPSFFGYFPANNSGPSVLGELVSAALGVNGMLWATSPAATELETLVLDWLVALLDLPPRFASTSGTGGGVIQDTASSATLCAILAARERAVDGGQVTLGQLVAYASTQAHTSVQKGMRVAGLGPAQLRLVEVDDQFAMRADALADAMAADRSGGLTPFLVVATVGTTSSTALDPVDEIVRVCRLHPGVWIHVDAAMAGSAAVCPELRFVNVGLSEVDSFCFNPHKWLFTNFDCDCFYVADRELLVAALSIGADYYRNAATDTGAVIDYRDWQVPLGRRFRALKLWFVLRYYGAEGLRHHIREHVALARELAGWVEADGRFELAAPVPLSLVCFRHKGGEVVNQRLLDHVNRSGRMFLTSTRLGGQLTLRLSVGQTHTTRSHVRAAWDLIVNEVTSWESRCS